MVIAFLQGILHSRELTGAPADKMVVTVGGVGFELLASCQTIVAMGDPGQEVTVHTSLSIRENEWTLFGFASAAEKEMFLILQTVTGVGPKMALSLVGTLGPDRIADAVAAEDAKSLSAAPGVGQKVAQRLILELKSKLEDWRIRRGAGGESTVSTSHSREEARAILEQLGYTLTEISAAFKQVDEADDVELLVRKSLKLLGA